MILGIDPGLDGAFALYEPASGLVTTADLPTIEITVNKKVKRRLDVGALVSWLAAREVYIDHVIIEEPTALPKQGVTSSFNFGWSNGLLVGVLAALRHPYVLVHPAVWKRAMQVSADKDKARQRASQLFPSCADQWALKKHDGRAEASLLAYYAHHRRPV